MVNKIKKIWCEFKLIIIAAAVWAAYFIGVKNGKNKEKDRQNKTVLANVAVVNKVRRDLDNHTVVRRLHNKYSRK